MPLSTDDIRNRFGFHASTPDTAEQHEWLRAGYIAFCEFLNEKLPDGRAKSTAMTNLQQSAMWAHFGIAEQDPISSPTVKTEPKLF